MLAWANAQPASADNDRARAVLAEQTFDDEPAFALEAIASMNNAALQRRQIGNLYPLWKQRDAASAQQWLQQNGRKLPADVVAGLQAR
jgi:hypothetical protein